MIIDHNDKTAQIQNKMLGSAKWNGAHYYSIEICRNIIPNVYTDRDWITLKVDQRAANHSIYFIHNNLFPQRYQFLKRYKDVVLVCGIPETVEKVKNFGTAIYLPLSIDIEEVEKYKRPKTKKAAFVGRRAKRNGHFPAGIDYLEGLPREELLAKMAEYEAIYAVGRCALEGLALGCNILPYDNRFPDPSVWKLLDNREAAKILQEKLDEIDG